jgi:hypothetical protein
MFCTLSEVKGIGINMKIYKFLILIFLFTLLIIGCSNNASNKHSEKLNDEEISLFISEQGIDTKEIVESTINNYVYIFFENDNEVGVYILEKHNNKVTFGKETWGNKEKKTKFFAGGAENGSYGIMFLDEKLLQETDTISLIINESIIYQYYNTKNKAIFLIEDERIRNDDKIIPRLYDINNNLIK